LPTAQPPLLDLWSCAVGERRILIKKNNVSFLIWTIWFARFFVRHTWDNDWHFFVVGKMAPNMPRKVKHSSTQLPEWESGQHVTGLN
jgi:hypothetical protein